MPFAQFMALALYHQEVGYYRRDRPRVGYGPEFHQPEAWRITEVAELLELSGDAAALVFSDLPNPDLPEADHGPAQIFATVITRDGRRGSELVRVAEGATLAGYFRVASDGDDIAIVYADDGGLWLQRLRFVRGP
mgnify:CR=1 FL=1